MVRNIWILLVLLAALGACVREDLQPCPPLQIMLGVEDKNYDNIDEVAAAGLDARRDDDEPFSSFIHTLYYVVEDYETREVIAEKRISNVEGDALQVACEGLDAELPFGKYIVTAWGNLPEEATIGNAGGVRSSVLHPESVEGADVYMVCDTLDYDYRHGTHYVDLERVKGKLLIEVVNLPVDVNWSDKTIANVAGLVNSRWEYEGIGTVCTMHEWNGEPRILTDTYLAPSSDGEASVLDVNFYDDASRIHPVCEPAPVNLPLSRNHITVVRYDYNTETGVCEVFMLVDSRWESIHGLEMD